jgi:hypothetical protein
MKSEKKFDLHLLNVQTITILLNLYRGSDCYSLIRKLIF